MAFWNGLSSPSMAEMLCSPSRPIIPISMESPSCIIATIEIIPQTGKQTYSVESMGSARRRSTGSRWGWRRISASGDKVSRR